MSAWSEAVWIVNKLQQNFDFSEEITYYTRLLNNLNARVNDLNSDFNNTKNQLLNKLVTFVSSSTPPSLGVANGAICFRIDEG